MATNKGQPGYDKDGNTTSNVLSDNSKSYQPGYNKFGKQSTFQRLTQGPRKKSLTEQLDELITKRPEYTAPSQIDEILGMRKGELAQDMKMPGLDRAKEEIGARTGSAVSNIKEMSNSVAGSLGAVSNAYKNEMGLLADLDVKGAMYSSARKQAAEDAYTQALQTKADYVDKAWNWNSGQKYGEQYNLLSDRITQKSKQDQANKDQTMDWVGLLAKIGLTAAMI